MDLTQGAIQEIRSGYIQEPRIIDVDGLRYSSHTLILPPAEPDVKHIAVSTLAGLIGLIAKEAWTNAAVHVASPTKVQAFNPPAGRHKTREFPVIATADQVIGQQFKFGEYYAHELFMIYLHCMFEHTDQRDALSGIVGNIRHETVRRVSDDGMSQTVEGSAGIVKDKEVEVPPLWNLRPFRTFREVPQPESPFVVRLQQHKDGLPQVALFEADGGLWKLTAINSVADQLRELLAEAGLANKVIA